MSRLSNKIKIYFYSSFIAVALTTIGYILSFMFAFDTPIAYFSGNSPLPYIAKYLLIFTVVWIFTLFISIPKGKLCGTPPTVSELSRTASIAVSVGFIICSIFRLIFVPASALATICTAMTLLSSVFFALNAIFPRSQNNIRALFGIVVILWAAIAMTEAYVNRFVTMNSPIKILLMLSMMSVMFFMLYETRYLTERSLPRAYAVSTLIGICLSTVLSLTFIIMYITGTYTVPEFIPTAISALLFSFYEICRAVDFIALQSTQDTAATNDTDTAQENEQQ